MEQFLKNFFNDNSVCVGLCDLKRKTDEIKFTFETQQTASPFVQQPVQQPIKPQKQTLAQKFAAQQQAYAEQQAKIAEQRRLYAEQLAEQKAFMAQQKASQKSQFAQHAYAAQQEIQEFQDKIVQQRPVFTHRNPYRPTVQPEAPRTRVIVNGNMKKVVSPAVPARY